MKKLPKMNRRTYLKTVASTTITSSIASSVASATTPSKYNDSELRMVALWRGNYGDLHIDEPEEKHVDSEFDDYIIWENVARRSAETVAEFDIVSGIDLDVTLHGIHIDNTRNYFSTRFDSDNIILQIYTDKYSEKSYNAIVKEHTNVYHTDSNNLCQIKNWVKNTFKTEME